MQVVDVAVGEEYITDLTFDASRLTLVVAVPEPSSWILLCTSGVTGIALRRRFKNWAHSPRGGAS
jgi:hypothetical protein